MGGALHPPPSGCLPFGDIIKMYFIKSILMPKNAKNVRMLYIKGGGIVAITTKEGILKVLTAFNPWWRSGAVHPEFAKRYRRFVYLVADRKSVV